MLGWPDVMMTQERNKDLLREAEQERLVQHALAGRDELTFWEKVKGVFSKFAQTNWAQKERECPTCPAATDVTI